MDKYSNKYHPDFVPGTYNIYADQVDPETNEFDKFIKKTGNGKLLIPQPTESNNDPLNWAFWRKSWHYCLVLLYTAFTAATSNSASSAQEGLNDEYNISYDSLNVGGGILFIGIGYGTLFFGPFTTLYGRRISYLICLVCSLIGTFWFGNAKSLGDVLGSQLFVGASEAASEAVAQLSITDIIFRHNLGSALTGYILAISVGVYLGPLIGGIEAQDQTFRAVGNVSGFFTIGLIVTFIFLFEESYFDRAKWMPISNNTLKTIFSKEEPLPVLLKELSQTYRNPNNPEKSNNVTSIISQDIGEITELNIDQGEQDRPTSYWKKIRLISPSSNLKGTGFVQYFKLLWINIKMMTFPAVILSGTIWGWEDALLTFYLTTEDNAFYDDPWDYDTKQVGIMNLPCMIGAIIGCFIAGYLQDIYVRFMARRNGGIGEAEYRLHFAILPAIIAPIGYLLFGLGTAYSWEWRPIYVGLGFIGFGWGCSGDIAMGYLMDAYPEMILEGMVGVSVINNSIGCVFTFACSLWETSSGTKNTYIVLVVLKFLTMFTCLPFVFWGKKWRSVTRKRYISYVEQRDGI